MVHLPLDPAAALNGRGLLLVREFSRAWGHRPAPGGGKVVWARLGPKPKE
ncbi:hypothetical protein [Actinomadura hibisca]|nr:hypothetical protein [Actinomadura hibisca]